MKKKNIFLLCCIVFTTTLMAQICPKNYELTLKTTYETLNNADGELEVSSFSGGTSPYAYSWSNGESTSTISNLSSGNYRLTITDANSCLYTMCAFVDKDSLPCGSSILYDPCGDTLPINYQFFTSKRPLQSGVLVQLYDEAGSLVVSEYNDTFSGNRFYFFLTNNIYYNTTYKMVLKGVFGSDTADFCGDTCSFTVEDFRCNQWTVNSCQPMLDINNQFWVSKHPHMTAVQVAVYNTRDSLLSTIIRTSSSGAGFYFGLGNQLYYMDTFKLVTRGIYNAGDTAAYCLDTCEFVVDSLPVSYPFLNNTCQDTVLESHLFIANSHRHRLGMLFEVYTDNTFSTIDTVFSSYDAISSTAYGGNLKNKVDPGEDYCLVVKGIFQNPYFPTAPADTATAGDTCCFYIEPSPDLIRATDLLSTKQRNSSFSKELIVSPNPTKEQITISNIPQGNQVSSLRVKIFDLKGAMVKEIQGQYGEKLDINISDIPSGQYHIQLFNGSELINTNNSLPFIKE